MITPEMARLVEAVRTLDLVITVKQDVERVRLNTPPEKFPGKLLELQKALMAFDKAESHTDGVEKDGDSGNGKEHLLKVSEALIYKIQKDMLDNREAAEIVNDALSKFAGSEWAGPQPKISDGKARRQAQERREQKLLGSIPRLTEKSVQGLDSAIHDAEAYRQRALLRAKADMERRAALQASLEENPPDGEQGPSASIK